MTPLGYAAAATVARGCVEAAVITFVLVGEARDVSSFRLGVLAACTAGPQLVTAPWLGARLDRARRPATVLAALTVVVATGIALVGAGLGRAPFAAVLTAAVVWSIAEPAVMGGLSGVASRSATGDGRLETADAASYGVAAVAGQGLVAVVVAVSAPAAVVAVLAGAGLLAALAIGRLPLRGATVEAGEPPSVRAGVRAIIADADLLAVTLLTTISMSAFGGLALAAVALAERSGRGADAGSHLVLAMALGAVPGALAARRLGATARPVAAAFLAVLIVGVAFVTSLGPWWLALVSFAVAGFADGPMLAATFTVRTARTAPSLRASVYTIAAGAKVAGTALGALIVGAVVDRDRRAGALVLAGFQGLALAAAMIARRTPVAIDRATRPAR